MESESKQSPRPSLISRFLPSEETLRHISYIVRAYPRVYIPESFPRPSQEEIAQFSVPFHLAVSVEAREGYPEALYHCTDLDHKVHTPIPYRLLPKKSQQLLTATRMKKTKQNVPAWVKYPIPQFSTDSDSTHSSPIDLEHADWGNYYYLNPKLWRQGFRLYNTFVPAVACFIVSFGASIYAPAVFEIQALFGVSMTAALAGITTYVLGMAFGPLIAGPISETIGRRAVYFIALPIFGAFTLGVAYAKNITTILVCRFFSATFGSSVLAVGAGTIADIWYVSDAACVYASCIFLAMAFMGPSFGPFVGFRLLDQGHNWQWTMFVLCMLTLPVMIAMLFAQETSKKAILKREFERNGRTVTKAPLKEGLKKLFTVTLTRPLKMICVEPIVSCISAYNGFCFAVFFAFFESLPYTLSSVYNSSLTAIGNAFLSIGIGVLLASILVGLSERFYYQPRWAAMLARDNTKPGFIPERRLLPAIVGSLFLPTGLFIFAWTAKENVDILVPLLGCVFFGFGAVSTFIVSAIYLVHIYDDLLGASALGANSLLRYTLGAFFPLFTIQMYKKLGINGAGSLLGGVGVLLLPIPWLLFYRGATLRKLSRMIDAEKKPAERPRQTLLMGGGGRAMQSHAI
ncbi:hypothetical protein ABW19_dt0208002 [Dactylella cylindrospora]|nr:hypothetical protein ABW19_dt0208002 [Dactylella cylindrospora]